MKSWIFTVSFGHERIELIAIKPIPASDSSGITSSWSGWVISVVWIIVVSVPIAYPFRNISRHVRRHMGSVRGKDPTLTVKPTPLS